MSEGESFSSPPRANRDARGVALRAAVVDALASPPSARRTITAAPSGASPPTPSPGGGATTAHMLALLRTSPLVYRAALRASSPDSAGGAGSSVSSSSALDAAARAAPNLTPRRRPATSPTSRAIPDPAANDASPIGFRHNRSDGSGVSPYVIRTAELRTERYLRERIAPGPYATVKTNTTPGRTGSRSPTGRLISSPTAATSPRARSPVAEAEGRNARLGTLVTEFEQHSLRPWMSRVHDINTRFERLNYVTEEELRFLRHVRRRCETFQTSLKAILTDGVMAGVGVDALLARQARELNTSCSELTALMVRIMRYANSSNATDAITGRVERPSQRQIRSASAESRRSNGSVGETAVSATPRSVRGSSPVSVSNASSTPPRRAVSPVPSLQDIPKPPARVLNPATQVEPETLRREDKKRMLEGIVSLEKRSSLSPSDLEWAESIFHRLYGTQNGMVKFHAWCKALTDTPLLLRPTYSRNGGVASRTALIDQLH